MTTTTPPAALRSGNPTLNDQFIATQLTPAAATTKTMPVAGVVLDFRRGGAESFSVSGDALTIRAGDGQRIVFARS